MENIFLFQEKICMPHDDYNMLFSQIHKQFFPIIKKNSKQSSGTLWTENSEVEI